MKTHLAHVTGFIKASGVVIVVWLFPVPSHQAIPAGHALFGHTRKRNYATLMIIVFSFI